MVVACMFDSLEEGVMIGGALKWVVRCGVSGRALRWITPPCGGSQIRKADLVGGNKPHNSSKKPGSVDSDPGSVCSQCKRA